MVPHPYKSLTHFSGHITFFLVTCLCLIFRVLEVEPTSLKRYEFSLIRMGTAFRMVFYAQDPGIASQASTEAFERIEQLEQILSDYREESELNRICGTAFRAPQRVSPELFHVLERSLHFSELSEGTFDVTIGPVVKLWREARREKRLPDAERLSRARLAVGFQNVVLDSETGTVFLKRDDMKLDLGAIAKGYAADQALAVLRGYGINRILIDAGGDLSLGDPPPGSRGWDIRIHEWDKEPRSEGLWLRLRNVGIATSGDTFQFLEKQGEHLSHIINPSDGIGIRDSVSTTVIAQDGISADALATALSILPVSKALALADSLENVSAFLVRRNGNKVLCFKSRNFPAFSR